MNKRIYISGPLTDKATGRPSEENLEAFRKAFFLLRDNFTYHIVNPTHVWACRWPWIYRLMERVLGRQGAYKAVLIYDLWLLMRCDYIYKIPGWRESRGANIESCTAYHMGIWPIPKKVRDMIDVKLAKKMEKWKENRREKT